MTLRARLALAAGGAVAIAIVAASLAAFFVMKHELRSQVDRTLAGRQNDFGRYPGFGRDGGGDYRPPMPALGGAGGYVQFVGANGATALTRDETTPLPVGKATLAVARGTKEAFFSDIHVSGTHLRVYTVPIRDGIAVQIARPLTEVDRTLRWSAILLTIVGAVGVLLAGGLGWIVSRAALKPVARLTTMVEEVAATRDLSRRVGASGRDELARLGHRFDDMLGALESAISAQRQLVADASHELRTPLTSLRTNVEVLLHRGDRLGQEDKARLVHDVVVQIEELTRLIGDLVDLARDAEPAAKQDDVQLDDLVARAVERAQSFAPRLTFATDLQPAVLEAVPERLDRAIANLLDNAAKWSPDGGVVEVRLAGGELTVRDHGPGIAEADLPHVFDRFYRAPAARSMPGSGLGLSIVRQVVEAHGGTVSAGNATDGGRGAVFRVKLPARSLAAERVPLLA